jgi:nicotinamide mononucleotide adenylyltransferase
MKVPVGVVHGRFQPLHLGHLEYILEGQRRRSAKVTTGTRVRGLLAEGRDWARWVPDATRRVVEECSIAERVSQAFEPITIGESSNAA